MKRIAASLTVAICAALIVAPATGQDITRPNTTRQDTEVLATGTDGHDRLTVPVKLGDSGPFRFMIDTGSQNTVVSDVLVKRLALVPRSKATLIGIAGVMQADLVEIDEIGLGSHFSYGILAPILQRTDIGADGILGLDSLQDQRVLIDFRRQTMQVGDARALGGNRGFEIVVTARRRSGQLILTNAMIDGVQADVVIDTGSDTTLGNRALQRELGRRGRSATQTQLLSVTGQQVSADIGQADTLEIHGVTFRGITIAFVDSPTFAHLGLDRRPAIFLGMREMRLFSRIAIDFKSRKVLFDLPPSDAARSFGMNFDRTGSRTAP
ncbi:MAG: retroviral-like aspartic protease family protein [Novosphingobium sp.]